MMVVETALIAMFTLIIGAALAAAVFGAVRVYKSVVSLAAVGQQLAVMLDPLIKSDDARKALAVAPLIAAQQAEMIRLLNGLNQAMATFNTLMFNQEAIGERGVLPGNMPPASSKTYGYSEEAAAEAEHASEARRTGWETDPNLSQQPNLPGRDINNMPSVTVDDVQKTPA